MEGAIALYALHFSLPGKRKLLFKRHLIEHKYFHRQTVFDDLSR